LRNRDVARAAGLSSTLVVWGPAQQKARMADAYQRALVDQNVLPEVMQKLGLATTHDGDWTLVLDTALAIEKYRHSMRQASDAAYARCGRLEGSEESEMTVTKKFLQLRHH
jgi:hypothetical protein